MDVVYDHQVLSTQEFGGISRYIVELAAGMAERADTHVTILAPFHMNGFLRERRPRSLVGWHAPPVRRTARLRSFANDAISRAWLAARPPSILHETYYRARSLGRPGTPTVITVYDMIHERFAELYPDSDRTAELKAAAVHRAAAVICISESTRRDLLERLPIEPGKVSVVHLAHAPHAAGLDGEPPIQRPYLLYVGHRRAYKNFHSLLLAMAGSKLTRELRLVCFGGGPFTGEELHAASALGLQSEALVQQDGDDDLLSRMYAHATAFVYPSLYEGFGIPVLEAMSFGCPVACSNTSSLPEVAGDAAEYFDPACPDAIAAAICRIVESPARADELRRRGLERVTSFSWDRCARETHDVYRRLL
ncbi:MAG TPA: glycosyltransferase family 1 protein [Gemmatimonadaceae bacterium]|nr:glycosyltransferase family 1 protein [Gemmatimonadaceae bacterium]